VCVWVVVVAVASSAEQEPRRSHRCKPSDKEHGKTGGCHFSHLSATSVLVLLLNFSDLTRAPGLPSAIHGGFPGSTGRVAHVLS